MNPFRAIAKALRNWRLRQEIARCKYRASRLMAWGDPEAARDQLDMAEALLRSLPQ